MCPLTRAEKYRILKQLPRRAIYIKECLRAHWKVNYKLKMDAFWTHHGLGAENLWHNHRFRIQCNGRVRWYFVNILDVIKISDVIDSATSEPFTAERWAMWIRRYHLDHLETAPTEREVDARVSQIMSIVE